MPAADPLPDAPASAGGSWLRLLCAALLAGLGMLTGARWLASDGHESVIQQPMSPADFVLEPLETSAPDPGDNL